MHNSKTHKTHRPRHKDVSKQHNSKPKKHHRNHHRSKNVLDPIQETSVEKIHVDQNACGDFAKDNVKNVAKDKHRRKKKVKNSEKLEKNLIVAQGSVENESNNFLSKTRNLFKREKSFEEPLEEKEKQHHKKKQKHREKLDEKELTKKSKQSEERAPSKNNKEKSVKHTSRRKHEKPCNTVQEVIFCQTHQVPLVMRNDKNSTEVKDLYKRLKHEKDHKLCKEIKEQKEYKKNENNESRRESKHFGLKRSCVSRDFREDKERSRRNHKRCKSEENNDKTIKDENKHSENKKVRKTSADIQKEDKKCQQGQSTTMKEEEIRKIVEGNMINYFAKFQHIIDKKLDSFMQFAKKDNEKSIPKLDENEPQKSKTRESKRSNSADVKKERKYKDEIVNEVLKKLRKEERKKHKSRHEEKKRLHKTQLETEEKKIEVIKEVESPKTHVEVVSEKRRLHRSPHTNASTKNERLLPIYSFDTHYISPLDCTTCSEKPLSFASNKASYENQKTDLFVSGKGRNRVSTTNTDRSSLENPQSHHPKCRYENYPFCCREYYSFSIKESNRVHKEARKLETAEKLTIQELKLFSSENSKKNKDHTKKMVSKTHHIVGIPPIATFRPSVAVETGKSLKDTDLVEKRKTSRRFKMYYKYSNVQTLKEECNNLLSDSNKDVTIPLEEEAEQEVFTKNTTIFTKLHECYFKPLASSHSEYCFDLRKKANSEQCHRYNHVKYESTAKDSKISTIKSKSDVLLTISHEKNTLLFKTVLDSLKSIEKSCKYNKECQVSDIKLTEVSLTDEKLEELEEIYHADIKYPDFKTNDPKEVYDVFGSSSKSNVTQEDSKKNSDPCERFAAEKIDVAVGSRSRITKNTVTKEVAVEAKLKTSIPLLRPQKRVKQLKSVAISPIYITDQTEMKQDYQLEAPKLKVCTPRSPLRKQTQQKSRERSSNKKSPPRTLNNNFELTCPQTVLTVEKHEVFVNNNDNMDQNIKNKLHKAKTPLNNRFARKTKEKVMKDHNVPTDTCLNACFPHSPRTPKTPNKKEGITSRFGAITKPLAVLPVIWKQKKGELKEINVSSTSSSLSDTLENVKRSQSLNDIKKEKKEEPRSKTTCGTKRGLKEYNNICGSFISNNIEKFANKPTVNRPQGIENDLENKLTGRLFLTKDYKTGEISSYQRRKLYDQSIRKRMKRKFKLSRMEMTPQVFEVRFLSMINQDNLLKERKRPISPIFSKKDNGVVKKNDKLDRGDNIREEDVDQSKKVVEAVKDEESSVTKIYFNKELKEQEALVELCKKLLKLNRTNELQAVLNGNKCFCSSFTQNCNGCHEFMSFLDLLHSSMSNYCTSSGLEMTNKEEKPAICSGGKFGEVFPGNFGCNRSLSCQSFGISEQNNCLNQPMSCPMLFDNSTSFDYLYEHSSDTNKSEISEKFLQSFTKVEHNFDMDMSQYNVENSCFYMSKSTTESGYSSIKSKQNSCSSFFKKCKIITMLKSKRSSELNGVTDLQSDCYRKMSEDCQSYAKKVRENSETKVNNNEEVFQEFSLNIMLADDYFLASSENEDDFLLVQFDKNNFAFENNCKLVFNNQALNLDVFMYLETDACGKIHQKAEQKFINMIMQAYDREFALCQSFLKNEVFLENVLVPAVMSQKRTTIKKARSEKFKSFFTRKSNESCMESKILMTLDELRVKEMVEKLALGAKKDFAMLAAAVKSNGNIDDGIKICGLLMLLERLCSGNFDLLQIDLNCDSAIEIEKEISDLFVKVFILSEKEAKKCKRQIGYREMKLLETLILRHKMYFLLENDLIAKYIGRGEITSESQLKVAVSYLMRTSKEFNIEDFKNLIKTT